MLLQKLSFVAAPKDVVWCCCKSCRLLLLQKLSFGAAAKAVVWCSAKAVVWCCCKSCRLMLLQHHEISIYLCTVSKTDKDLSRYLFIEWEHSLHFSTALRKHLNFAFKNKTMSRDCRTLAVIIGYCLNFEPDPRGIGNSFENSSNFTIP